jgi:hypothetical protein
MLVDPDGLALVRAICGGLGFAVGWCGGFMEAVRRRREFDAEQRAAGVIASDGGQR